TCYTLPHPCRPAENRALFSRSETRVHGGPGEDETAPGAQSSGPIPSQAIEIGAISRHGIVAFGRFEHLGHGSEPAVVHQSAERLVAERALANVRVPVAAAAETGDGVVQVEEFEPVETDDVVESSEHAVVIVAQVVARGPDVAGVEADADAAAAARVDALDHGRELLEGGTQHLP